MKSVLCISSITVILFTGLYLYQENFAPEWRIHQLAYLDQISEKRISRAAMDVLVPGIGEIIGGSQREERLDVLCSRIDELGFSKEAYWWYLDSRRFGSVEHSGFGLGFERLLMVVTGITNIRDVIPFPRTPNNIEF